MLNLMVTVYFNATLAGATWLLAMHVLDELNVAGNPARRASDNAWLQF